MERLVTEGGTRGGGGGGEFSHIPKLALQMTLVQTNFFGQNSRLFYQTIIIIIIIIFIYLFFFADFRLNARHKLSGVGKSKF